jgi:succinate dehydrogenase/fumarate reductase cytochrome b subunit
MFMDFHVGDSFEAARANSLVVFVLTAVATVLVGVRLW